MKKYILYLLVICLFIPSLSFAQERNGQLAYRYFRDKEYEAASSIFNELYQTSKARTYFTYYITCLLKLENYTEAEKSVKKEIRRQPNDRLFQIELGYIYKVSGDIDKANKQYNKTIYNIIPNKREYINVANALRAKREFELAIKTYQKGRLALKQNHLFHFEIATIYLYQRNFKLMVDEYMMALAVSPDKLQQIQSQLQSTLYQDINSDLDQIIKSSLISQVQSKKNNLVYKELLLWYYTQKKQFELAFSLAQSLDLLKNNGGEKLLQLAKTSSNNKDYITAQKCYEVVIREKNNSKLYDVALIGNLENRHLYLEARSDTKLKDWETLYEDYKNYFKNLKNISQSIRTLIRSTHLSAFKLKKIDEAKTQLQTALTNRNIRYSDKAYIKLELANINLLENRKWDAILLYSQIEQSNKNNTIGYEAKLQKAKVSYYLGEFDWAKTQLDVLKGSTSKLIANDALDLSQLIADNTTLDSTYSAMKYFAKADFLIFQNKIDSAKIMLNDFLKAFPGHSLSDEVHYKLYEIDNSHHLYTEAINQLEIIIKEHPYENLAAKSLFKQGLLFELQNRISESNANYKKIIIDYPESIYSVKAREKYARIRNKNTN